MMIICVNVPSYTSLTISLRENPKSEIAEWKGMQIFFLRILLHISKLPSRKIFPIYAITSKGWVCWPSSRPCQCQVFTLFSILIRWFYYYEVYFSILRIILPLFFFFALSRLFGAKMRVVKLETVTLWTRIPSSGGSESYFIKKCFQTL